MSKQKLDSFTLDLNNIQGQDLASADKNLQNALAETSMRSVFARIDRIYQDEREHDSEYKKKNLQELVPAITELLTNCGKTDILALTDTDQVIGSASSNDGPYLHLAFILQAIKHDRQIDEIMHGFTDDDPNKTRLTGLIDRFETQFYKRDFERSNFRVIDQAGNTVIENLPTYVFSALDKAGQERSPENIKAKLKETLNLSEDKLKFIVSKCNQRNIEGMNTGFTPVNDMDGRLIQGSERDRENTIHVTTDTEKNIISTDAVEHQFTTMRLTPDGSEKIPDYHISYVADISNLNQYTTPRNIAAASPSPLKQAQYDIVARDFTALPSVEAKSERLSFYAIHPDSAYALPPQLLGKTTNIIERPSSKLSLDATTDIDSQSSDSPDGQSPVTIDYEVDLESRPESRGRRSSTADFFHSLSVDALDKLNGVRNRMNSVISPPASPGDSPTENQSSPKTVSPLSKLRERAGSIFK